MNVGILITARLKSTRLPKKIILKIKGREIIRWMIDRLKLCRGISDIVLCTSTNKQDDILEKISIEEGIKCFRGSEEDVLVRLREASKYFGLDYIVNITADCPLVSIEHMEKIISLYRKTRADYISAKDLPYGFFSWGIKIAALKKVCQVKKSINTEAWTKYFTDSGLFSCRDIRIPRRLVRPDYRLTLDYPEDYDFLKLLFEKMGAGLYKKSAGEIVDFLDRHPEIVRINAHCKDLFLKRWSRQSKFKINKTVKCMQ